MERVPTFGSDQNQGERMEAARKSRSAILPLFAFVFPVFFGSPVLAQSKADSGWVPVFNGADFSNLYVYVGGKGRSTPQATSMFKIDSGMVHANGPYALLTTLKEYRFYRVRVDYRFANAGGSKNAGLIVLIDNVAADTVVDRRPRSIEVNMQSSAPWSLWAGENQGPYISSTVQSGTQVYAPPEKGGVPWTCEAWDPAKRELKNPTPSPVHPIGQWNHGEAYMFGDSGVFVLNGEVVTRGWHFQDRPSHKDADPTHRLRAASGAIALQSENQEIWYKNWEIMEIDSATGRPIYGSDAVLQPLGRVRSANSWFDFLGDYSLLGRRLARPRLGIPPAPPDQAPGQSAP
jgi:hypothetical protein